MAAAAGPAIYAIDNLVIEGTGGPIATRLYRSSPNMGLPVILFIHGGGFMLGNLDTHDAICRSLAVSTGAAVLAIDYRLSPEAVHPAALRDIAAVYAGLNDAHVALDGRRVAIVGDSAGGLLAAAAALSLPVRHVGLLYPMIDHRQTTASLVSYATGYMLTAEFIDWAWEAYAGRSPLIGAPLERYPPTTIVTAEYDPLRDEGEEFARRLRKCGRDCVCERFDGMIHGFAGMPQLTPRAGDAIAVIARRVRDSLRS